MKLSWIDFPWYNSARKAGFTLIELLTVIAIIAILAGILIPTATGARTAASRARTRVLFSQWIIAIEAFRQEYGSYPDFDASNKVNGGVATENGVHPFHDILSGRRRDGSALPEAVSGSSAPEAQNYRRISFITFTGGDLFPVSDEDAGRRNLLHDGFENTDIAILVDRNLDGMINETDYPVIPNVSPPGGNGQPLSPSDEDFPRGPAGGVRAGVILFSAPPRAVDASQLILSWK